MPAMLTADLLFAAGDCQGITRLPVVAEKADQGADAAEVGSLFVDAATTAAGVEMDAPAIAAHHLQISAPLLGAEGFDGFSPQGGIKAAAGAAARDAPPHLPGAGAAILGAIKAAAAGILAPGHGIRP
jgi:hypothetical protein